MTYEVGKLDFSARVHYLWNSVNHEPFVGSGADSVQPGQAFHMNYSVSYEAIHNLRVGFSGYWLQQTTDDKVNGVNVAHSLERTVGLGAGIQYFSGGDTWVHLNAYKETNVRNRAQGYSVTLRLSRGIPSSTAHPWTRLAEGFVYSRSTDVALPNHFPRIEKNQRWTRGNYA